MSDAQRTPSVSPQTERLEDDAAFVDAIACQPVDAWTGADKMRLLLLATKATHRSSVPSETVPRIHPTPEMMEAGIQAVLRTEGEKADERARRIYRAMVNAAPPTETAPMKKALEAIYNLTVITTGVPMEKAHREIHALAKPWRKDD